MKNKNLAKEAVQDVKSMVDLATEAAKSELMEQMAPALKKLIENKLSTNTKNTSTKKLVMQKENAQVLQVSEKKGEDDSMGDDTDMKDKDMEESLASFFAPVNEADDEEEVEEAAPQGFEFQTEACDDDDGDKKDMDEAKGDDDDDVEIDEAALDEFYSNFLQTEVQVKKGFSDSTKGGDFGKDKPDSAGGIAEIKPGEEYWEKVMPPAKQDFTVKEMIRRGMAENQALREKVSSLVERCNYLQKVATVGAKRMNEMNIFNAKLLHTAKFLNTHGRLSEKQKRTVVERIERAQSVNAVKEVYEAIVETFKVAQGQLSESTGRKPVGNAGKVLKSGAPTQRVLGESVDRVSGESEWSRIQLLAGLKNLK